MGTAALIHIIGSIAVFPSRAFLPAFVTAMLLRFGSQIPQVQHSGLLLMAYDAPTWFTHDITLVVLGILSVLELAATKSSDLRGFLNELDRYYKPALAALVTLGVLNATDQGIVQRTREAGMGSLALAGMVAAVVWLLAEFRGEMMHLLHEADPDDDLRLQRLIAWIEDLWAAAGILILVLYPLIMLGLAALVALAWYGMHAYLKHREERAQIPCASCGKNHYPCAPHCPHCAQAVAEPRGVGLFGQALSTPAPRPSELPLDLIEKRRCPFCATRLPERSPKQSCPACGRPIFADPAAARVYGERVAARLPRVLAISLGFSLIPLVGLIPGLLYYRFSLVAPFRRYVPRSIGCLVRGAVKLALFFLILLQILPGIGALILPVMALLEFGAYRGLFNSEAGKPTAAEAAPS